MRRMSSGFWGGQQSARWCAAEYRTRIRGQGLGGVGKSLLVTRLARDLAPDFKRVYWWSLRDAPSPGEWLTGAISFLVAEDAPPPRGEAAQVRLHLELLTETRCLLVLDNFETVLQTGERTGRYRPGYEIYGELVRRLAEVRHQSSLVLTTREEPPELGALRGEQGPVRVHGAFAESSSWNGVVTELLAAGYPVVAIANPLRGLMADAAYVSGSLASIPGPIVLVGHSYGGMIISNAVDRQEQCGRAGLRGRLRVGGG